MAGEKFKSVWDAICDTPEEAENMKLRSQLMSDIRDYVSGQQMDTKTIQKILGLTQPRVSYLMTGKIDKFSLDTLVLIASRAGLQVSISAEAAA